MKKFLFLCYIILSFEISAQQKPHVAIYMTGSDPVNEIASNRLMSDLINSGSYLPIERSGDFLAAVSRELSYERSGEVDDDQIAALGKQFGLQYVCVVSAMDVWQSEKYISAHIIDVNSAAVLGSFSSFGTLDSPSALVGLLDDLSTNLREVLDSYYIYYSEVLDYKPKIAVYVTRTGNRDVDIILGDQLVTGFAESGTCTAVERSNAFLKQLQKEMGYQYSGAVDDNKRIAELGKRFGVQYVCVVKTIVYGGAFFIATRLVNVETGEAYKVYNVENKKMEKTWDVIKVADEIVGRLELDYETIYDDSDEEIFYVQESPPKFPGGVAAMYRFISENVKYPQLAKENNIVGKVIVRFVIEKDGSISNPEVIKDIGGGCGAEVLRVLQLMPKWRPGRQHGVPVRSGFSLPVNFDLR